MKVKKNDQKINRLKKIWEIDSCFKCPVAGFCFSIAEQKKILKTPGNCAQCKDVYDMHQSMIARIYDKNRASEKAERILKNKFAGIVKKFSTMEEEKFKQQWNSAVLTENMAPLFYVAVTRDDLSMKFLAKMFGDIHMTGFAAVSLLMEKDQLAITARKETEKFKELFVEEKKRFKIVSGENIKLKSVNARVKQSSSISNDDKNHNENQNQTEGMEKKNQLLEKKIQEQDRDILRLEREKRKAEIKMFEALSFSDQLKQELNQLIIGFEQIRHSPRCTKEACPEFDFCSKRILIVGGLTKMKGLYKKIVESTGGIFDYHSGHIRNGKSNLEARVKRSDMVICPVNCNSHNACQKIKHLCSKHEKNVHLIAGSSLCAISRVLTAKSSDRMLTM